MAPSRAEKLKTQPLETSRSAASSKRRVPDNHNPFSSFKHARLPRVRGALPKATNEPPLVALAMARMTPKKDELSLSTKDLVSTMLMRQAASSRRPCPLQHATNPDMLRAAKTLTAIIRFFCAFDDDDRSSQAERGKKMLAGSVDQPQLEQTRVEALLQHDQAQTKSGLWTVPTKTGFTMTDEVCQRSHSTQCLVHDTSSKGLQGARHACRPVIILPPLESTRSQAGTPAPWYTSGSSSDWLSARSLL